MPYAKSHARNDNCGFCTILLHCLEKKTSENHFFHKPNTGYVIEGLSIYFKPYSTYLIFYVVEDSTITVIRVLKDRMYWQVIIKKMQKINRWFLLTSYPAEHV